MPGVDPQSLPIITNLLNKRRELAGPLLAGVSHLSICLNGCYHIASNLSDERIKSLIQALKEAVTAEIEDIDRQLAELGIDTSNLPRLK